MNTKTKLTLVAALFAALASPAFAVEQGSEQATVTVPANAYASATWSVHRHAPAHWSAHAMTDFQAQGSR